AHGGDLADGAGRDQVLRLLVQHRADALAADLENALRLLRCRDDFRPVLVYVDHGLLEIDVFAGVHGVDGRLLVPVVGRGDQDRVDVRAGQNLPVVARGEDVVAPELLRVGQAPVVTVRNRHQLHARRLDRSPGVALALPARADQR